MATGKAPISGTLAIACGLLAATTVMITSSAEALGTPW